MLIAKHVAWNVLHRGASVEYISSGNRRECARENPSASVSEIGYTHIVAPETLMRLIVLWRAHTSASGRLASCLHSCLVKITVFLER